MVSTTTGVAPFVSMLRNYLENPSGKDQFVVLQGASYTDEFGYDDELKRMATINKNIEYFPTCSRPEDSRNNDWKGEKGRVNNILNKYIDFTSENNQDILVYACGHPDMINDVKRQVSKELDFTEERFWKM